jgi:hypothetical protein
MRWAVLGAMLVACGGQILGEPNDAGSDSSPSKDASKDVMQPTDVIVADIGPPPPPSTMCSNVPMNELVAYYPLDSDTLDHSGHGFDATGLNLKSTSGVVGGAMHFDGTSSKLQVTSGSASLTGPRTLCAWSKSMPTTGAGQPLFSGGITNQGDFYAFYSSAPSNTSCAQPQPNTPYVDHWGSNCLDDTTPIVFGQWWFVCYAFDGFSVVMSVNATEVKQPGALYDYPLTTLFIGSTLGSGTTTKASFDGDIDEVSVWSVRLQPSELSALWNNGAACPL